MRTVALTLEYDGRRYAGWQIQPNGIAIQQVVEEALAQLLGEQVRAIASGRTDAGVHARGQVAHFETASAIPLKAFRDGLNRLLPEDVAVRDARDMPPGFHARRDALGKWYRYKLFVAAARSPLHAPGCWQLRPPLDLAAMVKGARCFVGEHDFAAFRTTGCAARTTRRRIFSCTVVPHGEEVLIDVAGNGFLRNMVRRMVGSLVAVGKGRLAPEGIAAQLAAGASGCGGATAPAHGLCLMRVWYPGDDPVALVPGIVAEGQKSP